MEARRREGRRGGPPVAPDGGLVPRHRGQLRVPDLLALLPGRHDRVRGPGHRDHGDQRRSTAQAPPTAPSSTSAPTRRSTSTSSSPAWTWRSTGRRTPSWCPRASRRPSPTPTPTAWPWCSAAGRCSTEAEGKQDVDWASQRGWKVVNRDQLNRLGTPTGYKLVAVGVLPGAAATRTRRSCSAPGSSTTRCGSRRSPRTSGGRPASSATRAAATPGLPEWTAADRSIADTDIVLWHVFGIHHVTRPEDWPVMPVDIVSFSLKPSGSSTATRPWTCRPSPAHCSPDCTGGHCSS